MNTPPPIRFPDDLNAEQALLGSMLLSFEAVETARAAVTRADFSRPVHADIFDAILSLADGRDCVDFVTVTDALRRLGREDALSQTGYLTALFDRMPTETLTSHYAAIVREKAMLRDAMYLLIRQTAAAQLPDADPDALLRAVTSGAFDIAARLTGKDISTLGDAMRAVLADARRAEADPEAGAGLATGQPDLDAITGGGFQAGDLVILAARPSMGKSALAHAFAEHAAAHEGRGAALFTLEMTGPQVALRLACARAELKSGAVKSGVLTKSQWSKLEEAVAHYSPPPFYIDDGADQSVAQIRTKCRRLKAEHGLALVVVDYLQLLHMDTRAKGQDTRNDAVGHVTRELKQMARELQLPVVALSQLSRNVERRENKRPVLSDLRDSGNIEQDADVVIFLYREAYYNSRETYDYEPDGRPGVQEVEVIVAKQRMGPTGTVKAGFVPAYARFQPLDTGDF